jgi:hypothetical protein
MAKAPSKTTRWQDAASAAATALQDAQSALQELYEVQQEYQDWLDNLPENLQGSALGDKLNEVTQLELDPDMIQDAMDAVDQAEGMDLPLGFGRD